MTDVLIVGGGVVGLSLAYELAGHGQTVRVVDSGQPGREASWAGAGILPPSSAATDDPLEQLAALSNEVHPHWSEALRETTGIDNGYRRCGAIYVEREAAAAVQLDQFATLAAARGIAAERIAANRVDEYEPALAPDVPIRSAYLVPDECQIRNPRHLRALQIACARRGVEITPSTQVHDFQLRGDQVVGVQTDCGSISAGQVCLTAGAWTAAVCRPLGLHLAIKPVRGQIVLFHTERPILSRIVNEGSRYLVPRDDGRLLAGSTEEDVGFDRSTTAGGTQSVLNFAIGLVPQLASAPIERTWAGLRPATADGYPYLGRLPGLDNVWIAAGHFRSGLQLSTGTAVVMGQMMRGEPTDVDVAPFSVDRQQVTARARPASRALRPRVSTN